MDELFTPIKSVLPNGLTIITMRTDRDDLIGAEMRVCAGWENSWCRHQWHDNFSASSSASGF